MILVRSRNISPAAAELFRADHRVILGIGDMLPCTSDLKRLEIMVDMITKLTR